MVKLREHGFKNRGDYSFENIGSNFKLSNLLASIGYSQLKRFNQIIKNKKIIYKIYNKNFKKLPLVKIPMFGKDQTVCMWAFPLIINDTIVYSKIIKFLSDRKIPFRKGFNFVSNYSHLKISKIKKKFLNVLLLPMNVNLNEKSAQKISLEVKKFIQKLEN